MLSLSKGRYQARFATGPEDVEAAQRLRDDLMAGDRGR